MSTFESKLAQLIANELDRLRANLETRGVIQDFGDYRYVIGQIDALKRVHESYFDEANKLVAKEQ